MSDEFQGHDIPEEERPELPTTVQLPRREERTLLHVPASLDEFRVRPLDVPRHAAYACFHLVLEADDIDVHFCVPVSHGPVIASRLSRAGLDLAEMTGVRLATETEERV